MKVTCLHADWLMQEATIGPNLLNPPLDEEIPSNDELIQEVKSYREANEVEGAAWP